MHMYVYVHTYVYKHENVYTMQTIRMSYKKVTKK